MSTAYLLRVVSTTCPKITPYGGVRDNWHHMTVTLTLVANSKMSAMILCTLTSEGQRNRAHSCAERWPPLVKVGWSEFATSVNVSYILGIINLSWHMWQDSALNCQCLWQAYSQVAKEDDPMARW